MKELTYHQNGDYLFPNLEAPEAPRIGKYGTMRHQYLRNHHRGIFDGMLLKGTLNAHLEEIDRQANEMMERLTVQMAQAEGVTEALKARNQMAWVQAMNSIKNRAEEIILNDLILS
ncbi:MAG: TnpV protein [Oscillospiraceae bacterium]|nr:TnpV protein [Oscillospiraceae bacterium]